MFCNCGRHLNNIIVNLKIKIKNSPIVYKINVQDRLASELLVVEDNAAENGFASEVRKNASQNLKE